MKMRHTQHYDRIMILQKGWRKDVGMQQKAKSIIPSTRRLNLFEKERIISMKED